MALHYFYGFVVMYAPLILIEKFKELKNKKINILPVISKIGSRIRQHSSLPTISRLLARLFSITLLHA